MCHWKNDWKKENKFYHDYSDIDFNTRKCYGVIFHVDENLKDTTKDPRLIIRRSKIVFEIFDTVNFQYAL